MDEQSMAAGRTPGNRFLRQLRAEVVTKDDGRYLIYYSWPEDEAGGEAPARSEVTQRPPQEPWSPEAGPGDV